MVVWAVREGGGAADLALAGDVADRLAAGDAERLTVVPAACEPPVFAAAVVEGDRATWAAEPPLPCGGASSRTRRDAASVS